MGIPSITLPSPVPVIVASGIWLNVICFVMVAKQLVDEFVTFNVTEKVWTPIPGDNLNLCSGLFSVDFVLSPKSHSYVKTAVPVTEEVNKIGFVEHSLFKKVKSIIGTGFTLTETVPV